MGMVCANFREDRFCFVGIQIIQILYYIDLFDFLCYNLLIKVLRGIHE